MQAVNDCWVAPSARFTKFLGPGMPPPPVVMGPGQTPHSPPPVTLYCAPHASGAARRLKCIHLATRNCSGSSEGGSDDVVGNIEVPLFCMGDASFGEAALTKNGYTSVALNLFEPRFCEMAKQILAEATGEKTFGYMERIPPSDENGDPNFVGEEGVLATVVWHRWLEKKGPGGRVAMDVVPGPRFKVLSQKPGGAPLGTADAPPLLQAEVELIPKEDGTEFTEFEEYSEEFIDVLGEGLDHISEEPEYIPAQASATTDDIQVRVRTKFQGKDRSSKQMVWAYEVTIANLHSSPVQILTRHWIITDGPTGEIAEVGPGAHGILGETPTIPPGRAIRYTSSTPLKSEYGCMEGSFEVAILEENEAEINQSREEDGEGTMMLMQAQIPKVALSIDGKPVKIDLVHLLA